MPILTRISPILQAGYARRRIIKGKLPVGREEPAEAEEPTTQQKEWKFTGWVSTKRDIKAAVDECVQNIKPKFGDVRPDVCFVFSSHQSDDKLRRIPILVKNALKPRAVFGSSSFGVFGAGGAMVQGQEIANKQALSIVAATMPDVQVYPFHVRTPSLPSFPPDFDWASHTLKKQRKAGEKEDDDELSSALFVITDGFDFREDELLQRLDFAFPSCPKFGGLASSRNVRLFVNDKAYAEGAAGLLLHGKFRLEQIKTEAFRPIGRAYKVSEVTPYSEKQFESFLSAVGGDESDEDGEEGDEDKLPNFTHEDEEEEDDDDDDYEEDLSSVIHSIDERTVHDVVQELADGLSSREKTRFLAGQFLVGVDPRVPSSGETRLKPPSIFVARNIREMEVDSTEEGGGYLTLYENLPKGRYIRFCLKDRNRGLADLRAKLARLAIPPPPAATAAVPASTPPVPFCPSALEGAGASEVGILGFSSIGRSLYAKSTIEQIELAHEGVFPLTGRTPVDAVADRLVEDMRSSDSTSEVRDFIEGELTHHHSNFTAAAAEAESSTLPAGGRQDEDWMAQLDDVAELSTSGVDEPQRREEGGTKGGRDKEAPQRGRDEEADVVDYSHEDRRQVRQSEAHEAAKSEEQVREFFEESLEKEKENEEEERRKDGSGVKGEEAEEVQSNATDADVITEHFGSRVTFGGMFCKGEFFTTSTRETKGQQQQQGADKGVDDDDERSTLLHGYINSLAVIMPPKSYHQRKGK